MATLKEFEDLLRQHGMQTALALLGELRAKDRQKRSATPARRVVGRKMTAELARSILELHATTGMTQQEIAFKLGVNQGRVNEVIKRGKWLSGDPQAPEMMARDKAMERLKQRAKARRVVRPQPDVRRPVETPAQAAQRRAPVEVMGKPRIVSAQLAFLDL
jgi:IS30 family transposase